MSLKKRDVAKVFDALAGLGAKEVTILGKFTLPGLCMIKTTKKPAKTIVKAFCKAKLKKDF